MTDNGRPIEPEIRLQEAWPSAATGFSMSRSQFIDVLSLSSGVRTNRQSIGDLPTRVGFTICYTKTFIALCAAIGKIRNQNSLASVVNYLGSVPG